MIGIVVRLKKKKVEIFPKILSGGGSTFERKIL